MIKSFRNKETEALFREGRGHQAWRSFERIARKKLLMLDAATSLHDLKAPPNNQLEALKGDREGQHSIRINDQYRVCFEWKDGHAYNVEVVKPRGH
jgi:proteic killer suppression protein